MLILLAILIFIYNFTATFYLLSGIDRLPTVDFLHLAAFPCGVVWWLRSEKRKSAVTRLYCEGLMASYGWAIMIPYHLLKTRGVKGLLPVFVLVASYFGAPMLAAIIYFAFAGGLATY
jgi:hypothetical protein